MKKIISIFICVICIFVLFGCEKNTDVYHSVPEIGQIKNICELSTIKCYFQNVATGIQPKGTGITHIGEKNREFWVEYTGSVKLGVDFNKMDVTTEGSVIKIYLPMAEIISTNIKDDTFTKDSYYESNDGYNHNPISIDAQKSAINAAQEKMKEEILKNDKLLNDARDRAKKLIENYVDSICEYSDVEYKIEWLNNIDNKQGVNEETTETVGVESTIAINEETASE